MRYYLVFVLYGLLMGALCVVLEEWMVAAPVPMSSLFGGGGPALPAVAAPAAALPA